MADIPHDIRSSLAIIKSGTELALMNPGLDPESKKIFDSTLREIDRIHELLKQLPK
ncbi:MAG: histidine kinase dimerization/phospho-acceptor domain-containing protein [bacterium]